MIRYFLLLFICVRLACANVDLSTQPASIEVDSPIQRAGVIILSVTADDFAGPSAWPLPYFMRIRLNKDITFAHTVVGLEREYDQAPPVYLPLCLESTAGSTLAAPPHAVEVLRYRSGEDYLWLRVNSSSSTWVNRQGVLEPPTREEPVKFVLGLMADESEGQVLPYWETNRANLPFQQDGNGTARHVPLLVATEDSSMSMDSDDASRLRFDIICFHESQDITTGETRWDYQNGRDTPVNLSGDDLLGLGIEPRLRVLSHLTPASAPFDTEIHMLNASATTQPMALFDGEDLEVFFVEPGLHASNPEGEKLDGMARRFMGDDVEISVTYATPLSAFSGIVPESEVEGTRFALFPGPEALFDGLVVVEHDLPDQTGLDLTFFDSNAQLLGVESKPIASGKNLFLMDDICALYPEAEVVLLEAEAPVFMQCLRGMPPYSEGGFVFESGPLPLDRSAASAHKGGETRIIPTLRFTEGTDVRLFLFNPGDEAETLTWSLKEATDQPQGQHVISLEPGIPTFIHIPVQDQVSPGYVEVVGDVVAAALFSTADGGLSGSLPAHQLPLLQAWAIVEHQADHILQLRVVNPGPEENTVFMASFDRDGHLLGESTLISAIPASGATILELEPFHPQAAYLKFHCATPAVLSLTREPGSETDAAFLQEWPWVHVVSEQP